MRFFQGFLIGAAWLGLAAPVNADHKAVSPSWPLSVQTRDTPGRTIRQSIDIRPSKTAVVVVDMWDRHWCKTYTARVANMVPRMNCALDAARSLGIQVVFAPSDVVDFYKGSPQRKAMQAVPKHPAPKPVEFNPPAPPGPIDHCECGPDQPCPKGSVWTRQQPGLRIAASDLIADCNNGSELLNLCQERGIDTLVYMGVASNMCVLHRSCGILNMKRHGLQIVVVRDLVEAITANGIGPGEKPDRNFTPAKGSAQVQRHIERYIAPTIESRQLLALAGQVGNLPHDKRPHVVFVISEPEYHSAETLPAFAKKHLDKDFRCTFVLGDPEKNDMPGLAALYDADLLVMSVRRQAIRVPQMDHLERYIRSGKPIVALRVSAVPFQVKPCPPGHVAWDRFDQEVLGCNYQGYNPKSRKTGCDVWAAPEKAGHPVLAGVEAKFHSPAWIYRQRPLGPSATVLLMGRWSKDDPDEPVAWTNEYEGGRVFYTTLGHPDDFRIEAFNRMLINAVNWALQR
jgi:nicotinamidase-related amidase/type 1 glutamine amidotransferase